ncbi:hypothetical protein Val02_49390 [Virgisporangium aliadipatigenens]|uniref:Uncharacterized protein n=1 Tax=Virgisporangium aliadipatigenens TaxID=741659 RepID=A0A8J3YQP6_9ACTN|nr:hypothetical protein Val02_49390 [Virgisporangium aliadipatigenens]
MTAVAASLAAVGYLKAGWLGIVLSIAVAALVPLQQALGAASRSRDHGRAAATLSALAESYERYLQLDVGPPAWRGEGQNLPAIRSYLDKLDAELSVVVSEARPVKLTDSDRAAARARAAHLIEYLSMSNVTSPPDATWAI